VLNLQSLHAEFIRVDLPELIDRLVAQNMHRELRDIIDKMIDSATVTRRVPEVRSTWLGLTVEWSEAVKTLLKEGQVEVLPAEPEPADVVPDYGRRERTRTWRARKRAREQETLQ
jgi:hypothetical protein